MTVSQEIQPLKKTPLYDRHLALQGKIVDFNGWALPVYYRGIITEHQWTREHCGIFDVSHLGEIHVKGPGALRFLQFRLTNDLTKIGDGQMLYNLLCDENGFTLDDILVYREKADDYYLIVNASNIGRDLEALQKYAPVDVTIKDHSDDIACIAVQGPQAEAALERLFCWELRSLGYYWFRTVPFEGAQVWISRSGYTGEDGFEIFSHNALAAPIWDRLAGAGEKEGILPAGLGARNTLRLEAGNALYGNDLNTTTSPLEGGLGWAVSFSKEGGFVGRDRLIKQKEVGPAKKLVAFKMLDKPIAREHYPIFRQGRKIGEVTSGSFGPTAGYNIGLGYVQRGADVPGTAIEIQVHGSPVPAEIVRRPFVPSKHKKG